MAKPAPAAASDPPRDKEPQQREEDEIRNDRHPPDEEESKSKPAPAAASDPPRDKEPQQREEDEIRNDRHPPDEEESKSDDEDSEEEEEGDGYEEEDTAELRCTEQHRYPVEDGKTCDSYQATRTADVEYNQQVLEQLGLKEPDQLPCKSKPSSCSDRPPTMAELEGEATASIQPLPSPTHLCRREALGPGAYASGPVSSNGRRYRYAPDVTNRGSPSPRHPNDETRRSEHRQQEIDATSASCSSDDAGLVQAREVDASVEFDALDLEEATPVVSAKLGGVYKDNDRSARKNLIALAMASCAILLVFLAGMTTGLVLAKHDGSNETTVNPPSTFAGNPKVQSPKEYLQSVLSVPSVVQENTSTMPASRALDWLAEDPDLMKYHTSQLQQRCALATFYFATNGEQWQRDLNWLSYKHHECDWETETTLNHIGGPPQVAESPCGHQNRTPTLHKNNNETHAFNHKRVYKRLWLRGFGLNGTIPEEIFQGLTSLQSIDLPINPALHGTIPSTIRLLTNLTVLSLWGTSISGTLPTEIGLLSSLQKIYKSNYASEQAHSGLLEGSLPTQLGLLTNLDSLALFHQAVTGTIPTELGLTPLELLALTKNQITGSLPSELGQTKLQVFDPASNHLTGTIPTQMGRLSDTFQFEVDGNMLTGLIPSELGQLSVLKELMLSENNLSGTVPYELWANWPFLSVLYLSHNAALSGTIPVGVVASQLVK